MNLEKIKCSSCGAPLEAVEWTCTDQNCDDGMLASNKMWVYEYQKERHRRDNVELEYIYALFEIAYTLTERYLTDDMFKALTTSKE